MTKLDLNLLTTLDVLLEEGSVTRAAKRLELSQSAMSRALSRLRQTTGDPLLVRSGRGLIPTPRALEIREAVHDLVLGAEAILQPQQEIPSFNLEQTFTLCCADGFVESFAPALMDKVKHEAPGVHLRFIQKVGKDNAALRSGSVDLEIGVVRANTGQNFRTRALFKDKIVGVVRKCHPLSECEVTLEDYVSSDHVDIISHTSQGRQVTGPINPVLNSLGLTRHIAIAVGGFSSALSLAREADLIASVPMHFTSRLRQDMHVFELPFPVKPISVSMLWHPRMDADPGHRWLRKNIKSVCDELVPSL